MSRNYGHAPLFLKLLKNHVCTVYANMHVKFEIHSF